jgi:hypothetical protein
MFRTTTGWSRPEEVEMPKDRMENFEIQRLMAGDPPFSFAALGDAEAGSRLFVGNLTIHSSEASRDHPDFAWWPTSKPAGHATYSELDFVGQNEADHQGQIGPAGDLSVVGEVSLPRLVDQASSFDL